MRACYSYLRNVDSGARRTSSGKILRQNSMERCFTVDEINIAFPRRPLSHFCRQAILTLEFQLHLASQIAGEFSLGLPRTIFSARLDL